MTLAYDGTDFCGWQRQDGRRTVQACIEDALAVIHTKKITLYGAGRTDSGVHARAQCANFFTNIESIKAGSFVPALNSALPQDIRVIESVEVDGEFHARFSAKRRRYRYFFIPSLRNFPNETRFALQLREMPDINLLNEYARLLRGEIDCALFASPSDPIFKKREKGGQGSGSTFRFIENAVFFMQGSSLVFEICANAFFRRMVRCAAGTLLNAGQRHLSVDNFESMLRSKNHALSGPTLPPQGLFLWNVEY